jgi:hypothetical protein
MHLLSILWYSMENLGWHGHHYVGFFIAFQGFYKDILAIQYPDWFLGSGNHLELVHHPIQQWRTQIRLQCKKWQVYIQHCLSFPFSGPLPACRNLFSSTQIFRRGRYQPGLGSSDQWKVTASLSLFLKSEKIRELLYVGKRHILKPFN